MNENGSPEVSMEKILPFNKNVYLWLIVGGSLGGALLIILVVALWLYSRRRKKQSREKSKQRVANRFPDIPPMVIRDFGCHYHIPPSSFTSSTSDDNTDPPFLPNFNRKPPGLVSSASIDVPPHWKLSAEHVHPQPVLPRWQSLGSSSVLQNTTLGTVQPDLYKSDDDEPSTPPCPFGRIWFSLKYNKETEELTVNLVKAKHLPGRGINSSPRDPFVKLYILPDEEICNQSKVRKRTLSPKFNETFLFKVSSAKFSTKALRLSVYDVDKRRVRHCLGHAIVAFSRTDLLNGDVIWRDLEPIAQPSTLGDIQVGLSCNLMSNKLRVTISKLRNVKGVDSGEAQVYVKLQLFHGRKPLKSKRTAPQKSVSPDGELFFDETFNFTLSGRYFDACSVTFTIFISGHSPLVKDQAIGRTVIGPFLYARGEQLLHWQEMLTNPRIPVVKWHSLKPVPESG